MRTKARFSRRDFIAGALGAAAGVAITHGVPGFLQRREWKRIPGEVLGGPSRVGHLLRDGGRFPEPTERIETEFLIVGGGMAGLSAAWWLGKKGVSDFLLLELDEEVGGSARWGKNSVSAYPWGAHYVPIPEPGSKLLVGLFEELGVIEGWSSSGLPIYNELYLSNDPQERIFASGKWQEGLLPGSELTARDRSQLSEFFAAMDGYRGARGPDGKRLFAIPIEESSSSPEIRGLDGISMAELMGRRGWDSPRLRWYVNYCTRDDYGAELGQVSAWAGIHYFASRDGKGANTVKGNVLTWPEGNGWIVERLREKFPTKIRSSALVFNIASGGASGGAGAHADFFDPRSGRATRVSARAVIFAAPRFVAARVLESMVRSRPSYLATREQAPEYSPWMVANLTLSAPLREDGSAREAPLSWDNVIYGSRSLGYVNAGNQKIQRYPGGNVLTYYWPLSHADPAAAREEAIAKSHAQWAEGVLEDLSGPHPDLREKLSRIDVWLWGHGMIRPKPGYIWGEARRRMSEPMGRVFFAHTDMSGIAIFEEAQYRGVRAAELALREVRT